MSFDEFPDKLSDKRQVVINNFSSVAPAKRRHILVTQISVLANMCRLVVSQAGGENRLQPSPEISIQKGCRRRPSDSGGLAGHKRREFEDTGARKALARFLSPIGYSTGSHRLSAQANNVEARNRCRPPNLRSGLGPSPREINAPRYLSLIG